MGSRSGLDAATIASSIKDVQMGIAIRFVLLVMGALPSLLWGIDSVVMGFLSGLGLCCIAIALSDILPLLLVLVRLRTARKLYRASMKEGGPTGVRLMYECKDVLDRVVRYRKEKGI